MNHFCNGVSLVIRNLMLFYCETAISLGDQLDCKTAEWIDRI